MKQYHFVGFFPNPQELWAKTDSIRSFRLANTIMNPHITTEFQPLSVDETLFGETVQITITGYGCDGKNEGLKVHIESQIPKMKEMIHNIPVPHITLSIADDAKSVNTRYLTFHPAKGVTFHGIYGGVTENGELILSSSALGRKDA